MQGGLSASAAARAGYHERFENEGCPGRGRVENVDAGTFWSIIFRPSAGESSFAGISTLNSTAARPHGIPCRPTQSQTPDRPSRGGIRKKERRLNHGVPLAYPTQETVQGMGGSTL
jgi:hypothetical protein